MNATDLLPSLPARSSILFVRLRSLGDTILSTPLYAALKAWRSDLGISVLVESPNDEVLLNNPDVQEVICLRGSRGLAGLFEKVAAVKRIRAARFDCCINLHGGSTSAWFTGLSGARYRVGLRNFRNRSAYNRWIDVPPQNAAGAKRHTVEYQMEWLRRLGLPEGETPALRALPAPKLRTVVRARLVSQGVRLEGGYCVLQPTSKFHTKEWTAEGFGQICDYIQTKHGLQIVLTGGPGEEEKLRKVAAHCKLPVTVVHGLSVSELMCMIQAARLFVGNDSGPTHLAAAFQVPVVVLFGSSDSQVWYPWRTRFQRVQNSYSCNPCPGYRCLVYDQPKCILSITAAQVETAIDAVLRVG
jgi:heptosyltransferase-3